MATWTLSGSDEITEDGSGDLRVRDSFDPAGRVLLDVIEQNAVEHHRFYFS